MRTRTAVCVAAAILGLLAGAHAAQAQAVTLRFRYDPGQVRQFERAIRNETLLQSEGNSRRTVADVPAKRVETVLDLPATPPGARIVILDTPAGQRLVAYEENGQNRLDSIPEANRMSPLPPVLATLTRDALGQVVNRPEKHADPMAAIEAIQAEMRALPADAVKPGDTWKRDVDFGIAKAAITMKFAEQKTEGGKPCAILEGSAAVTFTGEFATRLKADKMTMTTAVATDGSGPVNYTSTLVMVEKVDKLEQKITRIITEKLSEMTRLDAAQLDKVKADLAAVDKAMVQVNADDLDGALATLEGWLKDNAPSTWVGSIQNLHANIMQQRLMTKPVPPARLSMMLRDLQTARDRASAQGGSAQVAQVDQTIRQVATVNAKTLLEEAVDPDPIRRDLAAFGLAFLSDTPSQVRLAALAKDDSPQVRGSAAIALAIQGKPVDTALLVALLKDKDARARGAGALLAARTTKRGDPPAATLLPPLLENLTSPNAWTRVNTVLGVAALAPAGSSQAVAALLPAAKEEKEARVQPAFIEALKTITGIDSKELGPFEDWLKKNPYVAPEKPPALPEKPEKPPETPSATPPEKTPGTSPTTPVTPLPPTKVTPLPPPSGTTPVPPTKVTPLPPTPGTTPVPPTKPTPMPPAPKPPAPAPDDKTPPAETP